MPKAERGSIKDLSNRMKAKGLQKLRWYCQVCEKQMRDENGFRNHTQSEAHVRQMLLVGENAGRHISNYSSTFQKDFVDLLKSAHGTKSVQSNHFYNEYISNKTHTHMNATRWNSLTEFVAHLGRNGIVRVTDKGEKGIFIAWIDTSPQALSRSEANRRRERLEKSQEERERIRTEEQLKRMQEANPKKEEDGPKDTPIISDAEREKVSIALPIITIQPNDTKRKKNNVFSSVKKG